MAKPPRDRRTEAARQRTYIRLRARVDHLEDASRHFYNVINELRRRVSTLEKKLKPLAKDHYTNGITRMIEFLAQMPTGEKIFLAMAVLGLAAVLIVLRWVI